MKFLTRPPRDYLEGFLKEYCALTGADLKRARLLIKEVIDHYQGKYTSPFIKELEDNWYEYIPDYKVYSHPYYFVDLWACWITYSRQYLLSIKKTRTFKNQSIYSYIKRLSTTNHMIDLGCGLGFTSLGLKELFPNHFIHSTNYPGTDHFKFSQAISEDGKKFRVFENLPNHLRDVDLIFASEYFEHIQDCLDHLDNIIYYCKPKFLLIANAFNSTSIGHFNMFVNKNNGDIRRDKIGRIFNKTLREHGYIKQKTKLWNNRPNFWIREDIK